MLSKSIKVGNRIEVTSSKDYSFKDLSVSQVEDIIDEYKLVVHVPISYGKLVKLNMERKYYFLFFTEKGMVLFEAHVIKVYKENQFHLMQIELLSEGEKVQRREYFRLPCMLPLKFSAIDENNPEVKSAQYMGIIRDISGGGLRFVSNDEIGENAKIKCIIVLNNEVLLAIAKVLHKQYFRKSTYKFQYRVVFVGILPDEREKIVQHIFNEQRSLLQKTMGK